MAKIILSGKIYKSFLSFTKDALLVILGDYTDDGSSFMHDSTFNTESPIEIILQNDHHLIMSEMESSYLITCDITDGNLTLNSVTPKTSFCIKFLGKSYQFTNEEESTVDFGDMNKFVKVCETVSGFFENGVPEIGSPDLPLEKICFLRDYQKLDHALVSTFMQQNNKVSTIMIDSFINNNFCELSTTAHSLAGSVLDGEGPYNVLDEILSHICSNLELEEVNLELAGANVDNVDSDEA